MKDLPAMLSAMASVLWPVLTIVVVLILLPEIRQILMRVRSAQSFNLKWGDKEITVQEGFDNLEKVVRDIITEMQLESPTGAKAAPAPLLGLRKNEEIPSGGNESFQEGTRILWVDDKPQNNLFEGQQLKSLGWEIDEAVSTRDALSVYSATKYGLVITDMYRREDGNVNADAGIDLLQALREINSKVRVVCFCGSGIGERLRAQFLKAGGLLITSSSLELLRFIGKPFVGNR